MTHQRSAPGGKAATTQTTRRRGHEWSSGAWKHKPQKRGGISAGAKARLIALAILFGLAIALPSPF